MKKKKCKNTLSPRELKELGKSYHCFKLNGGVEWYLLGAYICVYNNKIFSGEYTCAHRYDWKSQVDKIKYYYNCLKLFLIKYRNPIFNNYSPRRLEFRTEFLNFVRNYKVCRKVAGFNIYGSSFNVRRISFIYNGIFTLAYISRIV